MKPIHFIATLFAITVGLLDLVVLTGFRSSYATPLMLFAGLALGQMALLAFWCVLGGGLGLVRLLAALAAAAGLSHPMARVTGDSWPQWFTLFFLFTACTAGSIALARFLGFRATIMPPDSEAASQDTGRGHTRQRYQFSLGGLLSVMTAVGIALGLSRHFAFPKEQAVAVAAYGFWLVVIATTSFWALMSRQALLVRLFGLATLCLVSGWFMARAESQPGLWFFTNVAFIEAVMICMGIAVIQGNWCVDQHCTANVASAEIAASHHERS